MVLTSVALNVFFFLRISILILLIWLNILNSKSRKVLNESKVNYSEKVSVFIFSA